LAISTPISTPPEILIHYRAPVTLLDCSHIPVFYERHRQLAVRGCNELRIADVLMISQPQFVTQSPIFIVLQILVRKRNPYTFCTQIIHSAVNTLCIRSEVFQSTHRMFVMFLFPQLR